MNFQRGRPKEEPEINLVPMIDVLLVILIFLVVTTTYSKFAELEITLPEASNKEIDKNAEHPGTIDITVTAMGEYTIDLVPIKSTGIEYLRDALRNAAKEQADPLIVINGDENASHQSVIKIMEAARLAGYSKITFVTEIKPEK